MKDAGQVIGYAYPFALSLPDRENYFDDKFSATRVEFLRHVERTLVLGGVATADAKAQAEAVLRFETRFAQASFSRAEQRCCRSLFSTSPPASSARRTAK